MNYPLSFYQLCFGFFVWGRHFFRENQKRCSKTNSLSLSLSLLFQLWQTLRNRRLPRRKASPQRRRRPSHLRLKPRAPTRPPNHLLQSRNWDISRSTPNTSLMLSEHLSRSSTTKLCSRNRGRELHCFGRSTSLSFFLFSICFPLRTRTHTHIQV